MSTLPMFLVGLTPPSLLVAQAAAAVPPPAAVAGTEHAAILISSPRYLAVLSPASPHDARSILAALPSCAAPIVLDSAEVTRLAALPRWADTMPISARGRLLELTVTPQPGRQIRCEHPESGTIFARHALEVTLDSVAYPSNDVGEVAVLVDGRVVQSVLTERIPMLTIGPNGFVGSAGLSAIRVHLRFDDLVPRGPGAADVIVRVARQAGGTYSDLSVPSVAVNAMLEAMLVPRVASLQLRQPELAGTTLSALDALRSPTLASSDRARLYVRAGAALLASHDTSAAQLVLGRAAVTEPCLRPAEGGDPALAVMMAERRPPTRCTPLPARPLLLAGLLPGGALRKRALRGSGGANYVLALVVAGGVTSIGLHGSTSQMHRDYRDEVAAPERLYAELRSRQSLANAIAISTWAVWGGSVGWALWQERQYRRRLEGLSPDREAESLRLEPLPRGLGFSLTFF